jgi:hypothetical protein
LLRPISDEDHRALLIPLSFVLASLRRSYRVSSSFSHRLRVTRFIPFESNGNQDCEAGKSKIDPTSTFWIFRRPPVLNGRVQVMNGKGKEKTQESELSVEQQKRNEVHKSFENKALYCLRRVFCGKAGKQWEMSIWWDIILEIFGKIHPKFV